MIDIFKKIFKPNRRLNAVFKQHIVSKAHSVNRTYVSDDIISFRAKENGVEWYYKDMLLIVNGDGYLVYLMKGQEVTEDTTVDNRDEDTIVVDTPHLMSLIDFLSVYCGKAVRFSVSDNIPPPTDYCGSTGK